MSESIIYAKNVVTNLPFNNFTPRLTAGGVELTLDLTQSVCKYQVVGKICHFILRVRPLSKNGADPNAILNFDLPVEPNLDTYEFYTIPCSQTYITTNGRVLQGFINWTSPYLRVEYYDTAFEAKALQVLDLSDANLTNTIISFTGFYRVE